MKRSRFHISLQVLLTGLALALGTLAARAQQLIFTPFHANGIYAMGERAGWTVKIPQGSAARAGAYRYEIRKNNSETIKTGVLDLSFGSHVHGCLAKPARGAKFPALVIFQWAGVYALQPEWATERAAEGWLAFDKPNEALTQ